MGTHRLAGSGTRSRPPRRWAVARRTSRTCVYRPHHATTARDVDWEWNGVRSGRSLGDLTAVCTSSTRLLDSVLERSNTTRFWTGSWSHLVPPMVQKGPTVQTLRHPKPALHGLSSQFRGSMEAFYLRRNEGLFPPEKRKVGGSVPPLTTR